MPLPVMLAAAVALFLLAVIAVRVWAHRSRAQPETVTEAAGAGPRVTADKERPVGQSAASAPPTGRRRHVTTVSVRPMSRNSRGLSSTAADIRSLGMPSGRAAATSPQAYIDAGSSVMRLTARIAAA